MAFPALPCVLRPIARGALWAAVPLCLCFGNADAASDNSARYGEIRRSIKANRHLSGHLTLAVDARTIKAIRRTIGEQDIPVLLRMMGDQDYGIASAASGLLVTLGDKAAPALAAAAHSGNLAVAGHARDALMLLERCGSEPQATNPDVCPSPGAGGKP